ncbi:hypothetical protein Kpol_1031p17 [Vanderwaltozyma polyspora DSM 70294]|uniref:VHS domain-containing protein n=1 Tax=Vanderwaltozyma polyspora (strain ATCC 22028 / DSM 70294 / BCRC 21397 / CBS 2163 / NBRC 10782 / NRRL Y-8283 / UCD 57-17) TaxID=436907 RepID=A7THV1_VANPO|nr:uncharacterized protein Kpol_1031p17 [Vanderwaltozyma polyspora DSM 70294]EDO18113.1 hypothetical protein Kpol_1031p17 [Vanderwaltozyma polyspora DSM 70294]
MSHGIYLTDAPVRRPQTNGNPLLRKIQRACRMSLSEPDLALNLDVADYINEKQGASSRDAVITIARLINTRDTHTAVFALALLDVLVKNCGYPVHLQISRKEFLNELVKRFPEHPPMRYSKVQRLVLTAIEEWYQTICKHATYKEDMGFIRDMHRLLKYKGYVFPKIDDSELSVLRPNNSLKSASEIQKEQEIAQAAKLEELIRRGKPEDLKEANKLMKIMAGFKEDNLVQAKQAIVHELNKLKRKADLLNEMLNSTEGLQNETVEELYGSLKSAQPKFQKIIEEEQDEDTELVQDLLKFNDNVNQILEKYRLLKDGNTAAASQINPAAMSSAIQDSHTGALANELNLIDFDDDMGSEPSAPVSTNNATTSAAASADPLADLLGDLGDMNISTPSNQLSFGQGGDISLGSSQPAKPVLNTDPSSLSTQNDAFDLLDGFDTASPSASKTSQRVLVNQSSNLKLDFELTKTSNSSVDVKVIFSNLSSNTVNDLTFLLAAPKTMTLKLLPQSGNSMNALVSDGITQTAKIENATLDGAKPLKLKWKVTYTVNNSPVEETAVFTLPKV